jgi:hypothetical protein
MHPVAGRFCTGIDATGIRILPQASGDDRSDHGFVTKNADRDTDSHSSYSGASYGLSADQIAFNNCIPGPWRLWGLLWGP